MTTAWERKYVADRQAKGINTDELQVAVTIYATFNNFISFAQATALGEDGGELAGLKKAWADFVKAENGILNALQNADKLEVEWEVEPR